VSIFEQGEPEHVMRHPWGHELPCWACGARQGERVAYIFRSGRRVARWECRGCGRLQRFDLPRAGDEHTLRVARDNRGDERCEHCGCSTGVEVHHWAPRYVFGTGCRGWPTALLCRRCHRDWHIAIAHADHGPVRRYFARRAS
jgi:hypothetical protein